MVTKNYILVPGAWHGGWCYARVAERLRARGHRVFTPTLTGVGERSHLCTQATNCSTHVEDILAVMRWEELDDVILCGHSYAGMVISGVTQAAPERVQALVYLDAVVPKGGKSFFELMLSPDQIAYFLSLAAEQGGGYRLPPLPAEALDVNPIDRALVDRMCTMHPLASLNERIKVADHPSGIRRSYIHASGWRGSLYRDVYERVRAEPGWSTHTLACGHDIMLDAPDETAQLMLDA